MTLAILAQDGPSLQPKIKTIVEKVHKPTSTGEIVIYRTKVVKPLSALARNIYMDKVEYGEWGASRPFPAYIEEDYLAHISFSGSRSRWRVPEYYRRYGAAGLGYRTRPKANDPRPVVENVINPYTE